jgi:hypothetical protein
MRFIGLGCATVFVTGAGVASGAFDGSAIYGVGSPLGSFATQVGGPLIVSDPLDYTFDSGTTSGYTKNGPIPGTFVDSTVLTSTVWRVTSATSFNSGPNTIMLSPGDRVFAYTIDLVEAGLDTVEAMGEFEIGGSIHPLVGSPDDLAASLVKGYGFLTPGIGVATPINVAGNFTDFSTFGVPGLAGGALDWRWGTTSGARLENSEVITLLMFTGRALIGEGFGEMIGLPGAPNVDATVERLRVLIPIVPSPAPVALGALGLATALRRRRE